MRRRAVLETRSKRFDSNPSSPPAARSKASREQELVFARFFQEVSACAAARASWGGAEGLKGCLRKSGRGRHSFGASAVTHLACAAPSAACGGAEGLKGCLKKSGRDPLQFSNVPLQLSRCATRRGQYGPRLVRVGGARTWLWRTTRVARCRRPPRFAGRCRRRRAAAARATGAPR